MLKPLSMGCKQKITNERVETAPVNAKHKKTLAAIFSEPVPKQLAWKKIESLLTAAGADLIEGKGSRVRFHKDGEIATFHRPHPKKEAKPYQIRDARDFLARIGVTHERNDI
jgi:predicted RNA binding protein YcfA (HicA-like mRNA interferase family)